MRVLSESFIILLAALGAYGSRHHDAEQRPIHYRPHNSDSHGHRVAIIGAGAAGSSAAFWLSKAKSRLNENITVTIYDKNDYIGGRSTTIRPYNDESLPTVELGASIYVIVNKNLVRAVKEFNFPVIKYGDENEVTTIWDGQQFVLTIAEGGWWGWWYSIKLLWRYGYYSPTKSRSLVKNMIDTYLNLYNPHAPHDSVADISASLNFTSLTSATASNYLGSHGVSQLFVHELVEAATRVNYGQNVDDIHALEGMVSLAATGAQSVAGGNWQVFDRWIKESGAKVKLGTTVQTLRKGSSGKWHLGVEGGEEETFDTVVLAAPVKGTNIKIEAPELDSAKAFPPVDYVHLHVTLLSTTSEHPQASYFIPNAAPGTKIPQTILTTSTGPVEPEFNSLTYHETIERNGKTERIVKIFSKTKLDDAWLEKVFGSETIGWVFRKEWDAYPVLPPTTTYPSIRPATGLYYVNAFEPFISTMETETISSLNVVDLLLQDHYGRGVCGQKKGDPYELPENPDFVWGWDCP
ncbi:prenylcysteine lyase [Ceratobasidium sp. AG-Ba]|nr:prenylcysteine lyase [Ceratobasidium sp. AG-Ba]